MLPEEIRRRVAALRLGAVDLYCARRRWKRGEGFTASSSTSSSSSSSLPGVFIILLRVEDAEVEEEPTVNPNPEWEEWEWDEVPAEEGPVAVELDHGATRLRGDDGWCALNASSSSSSSISSMLLLL